MSTRQYNDLNVLTFFIDNQKKFMNHKKQLDSIYNRTVKHENLGLENEVSLIHYNQTIKNNQFKQQEIKMMINRNNDILYNRIDKIKHRENKLVIGEKQKLYEEGNIKKRSNNLKSIELAKLQNDNDRMYNRIHNKVASIPIKKYDEEYLNNQYYKELRKKFDLPNISKITKKMVGEESNMYLRKNKEQFDIKNFYTLSEGHIVNTEQSNEMSIKTLTDRKTEKDSAIFGNFGLLKEHYVKNQRNKAYQSRILIRDS